NLLFPSGAFFFPFTLVEILGGVLFALFYYRAPVTTMRVILGRFSVTAICNLILNPICMYYYYMLLLGKSYTIFSLPRIIKNLALFPVQSLILVVLFNALLPVTNRLKLTHTGETKLQISRREIIAIVGLTVFSALAVAGYYLYDFLRARPAA
ncbi:MAG: hypothetical protein J6S41_01450, partial [Clostridia bacterium]|nr:hypothetical protein [Clostridia bacterium]